MVNTMTEETLAPVLRVQDADAAIAWYKRLGFEMDFQHSSEPPFQPGMWESRSASTERTSTTAVVKRGDLVLILSKGTPDTPSSSAVLYLRVADVAPIANDFQVTVQTLQTGGLIGRQIELLDPDGNRIRVAEFAPAPALIWPH